jgi:hypothetical protein
MIVDRSANSIVLTAPTLRGLAVLATKMNLEEEGYRTWKIEEYLIEPHYSRNHYSIIYHKFSL